MNCKKCGKPLYEGVTTCLLCGYSEVEEKRVLEREIDSITISKYQTINNIYWRIFGNTDKRIAKKILKYLVIILLLCSLFYHFFIYIDIRNRCFVTIRPAMIELSNSAMKKGIIFLKKNFPNQYKDFCTNITSINPNISCGGFGGGCYSSYHYDPGIIDISTPYGDYKDAAKVIIHETCHAIQFKEGRPFDETECHEKDSVIPWR
jgi:hypothetical protein